MMDKFFKKSKCITNKEEKEYLLKLLGNKQFVTTLLYRGSLHGWKPINFTLKCYWQSPTISLFKLKDGDCIGGFTNATWTHHWFDPFPKFYCDNEAMLFNLTS